MDRDELQDRLRARRSGGGEPYRRGGTPDEERGYRRYEPDPNDAGVRRGRSDDRRRDLFDESAVAGGAAAADVTRDRDEWSRPAAIPTPASAPPPPDYGAPPSDLPLGDEVGYEEVAYPAPANVDNFDDEAYEEDAYPYEYDDWEEEGERRPGAGAVAILGFLALGVLALLGGAVLAGVFSGDPGTGQIDPTPTASASVAASAGATPTDTPPPVDEATPAPTGQPGTSGDPVVFPDGFTAQAEPCLPGSAGASGCDSNGASNGGVVDIWVGFENGSGRDVVGATVIAPDGSTADGSIDLARIGCSEACRGWTYFPFRNLEPGTYEVEITRNGEPAGSTSFEVTS